MTPDRDRHRGTVRAVEQPPWRVVAALVGGAYAVGIGALAGREVLGQLWPAVVGMDVTGDVAHPDGGWLTAALAALGLAVGLGGMVVGALRGRAGMARTAGVGLVALAVALGVGAVAREPGPRCSERTYSHSVTCVSDGTATLFDLTVLALPPLLAGAALVLQDRRRSVR